METFVSKEGVRVPPTHASLIVRNNLQSRRTDFSGAGQL